MSHADAHSIFPSFILYVPDNFWFRVGTKKFYCYKFGFIVWFHICPLLKCYIWIRFVDAQQCPLFFILNIVRFFYFPEYCIQNYIVQFCYIFQLIFSIREQHPLILRGSKMTKNNKTFVGKYWALGVVESTIDRHHLWTFIDLKGC